MPKLDEQIKPLAGYFAADCEPDGKLTLQLEVEHFSSPRSDGQPPAFADGLAALRDVQQQTERADHHRRRIFRLQRPGADGHAGARLPAAHQPPTLRDVRGHHGSVQPLLFAAGAGAGCPRLARLDGGLPPDLPCRDLPPGCPAPGTRPWTPTCGKKGACSVQMMRATAATQVSIDYQDETDFCPQNARGQPADAVLLRCSATTPRSIRPAATAAIASARGSGRMWTVTAAASRRI